MLVPQDKKSPRIFKYECQGPDHIGDRTTPRDMLVVKRVVFTSMGKSYRSFKSRTVAWLCTSCAEDDPAWSQTPWHDAPASALELRSTTE